MVYNFREYKCVFDTPAKKHQEKAIATKIMDLLNKNKYDNLDDFINKNSDYSDFLKNNSMENVVKHFGNTLNQDDYSQIIKNLQKLTKEKMSIDTDNIKNITINGKEYTTFNGSKKDIYLDNSLNDKSIENQLKDLQDKSERFQTSNPTENTERLMTELASTKKQNLKFEDIDYVNYDQLTDEEKKLYWVAKSHEESSGEEVKIDFDNKLIADEDNDISLIEKRGNNYVTTSNNDIVENEEIKDTEINKILDQEKKNETESNRLIDGLLDSPNEEVNIDDIPEQMEEQEKTEQKQEEPEKTEQKEDKQEDKKELEKAEQMEDKQEDKEESEKIEQNDELIEKIADLNNNNFDEEFVNKNFQKTLSYGSKHF